MSIAILSSDVFIILLKHSNRVFDDLYISGCLVRLTSPTNVGRQHRMKYKCFKSECPVCHNTGSIQLFINNKQEVRYARIRHYSNINKDSKKPQFTYCKINNKEELKTLLSKQGITLTTTASGQVGQTQGFASLDHQHGGCATKQQNKPWASSSARIEHQPPKLGVEGSNPSPPATADPRPFWRLKGMGSELLAFSEDFVSLKVADVFEA
jgi:hypothetical protein